MIISPGIKGVPGCYAIHCFKTGREYIGSTIDLARRRAAHFYNLRRGWHHNKALQSEYNEFGREAFSFKVKAFCFDPELTQVEAALVASGANTYNDKKTIFRANKGPREII